MSVKKVQSIRNSTNQSNRRYGRKLIRVCSIGNYQMGGNPSNVKESSITDNAKYQKYQIEEKKAQKK